MNPVSGTPSAPELADGIGAARPYVKRIIDVEVRFVDRPEPVATLEGAVACAPGDALVTGPSRLALPAGKGILGTPGDWLVQYAPGDQAIVNGAIFCETYGSAD